MILVFMLRSLIVVVFLSQIAHALDKFQAQYVIFESKKEHCLSIYGYFESFRDYPKLTKWFPVSNAKINDIVHQLSKIHSLAEQIRQLITNQQIIPPAWLIEIGQHIRQLKRMQRNPFQHELKPFNRSDYVPKFFEWCSKVGIYYDGISLQAIPGSGYGVVAAKDLPSDYNISKVPCNVMLSANEMKNLTREKLIPLSMAENNNLPLALKLIFETFEPSAEWSPYVEFLPRELFHPLMFEPEDFVYLEGSRTYQSITDHYFTYMVQYILLYLHMLEQPQFFYNTPINWETLTYRLFMWATVNVQSRVLGSDSCTGVTDHVLVPLYDMVNHGFDKNSDSFTDKDGEMSKTVAPVEAGQEVVHHYGPQTVYTASYFTIWSAHCPGHRYAPIQANKSKLNLKSAAGMRLKSHEIALKDTKDIVITGFDEYLVGDDADLIYLLIAYGDAAIHDWPDGTLTSRMWQNAWREFRALVQAILNGFRRTLPVNLAEYADNTLSKGAKECLLQTICEQKILLESLDAAQRLMAWTDDVVEDFGKRLLENLPNVIEKIIDKST